MGASLKRRLKALEQALAERTALAEQTPPLRRVQSAWKAASVQERMQIIAWIQDQLQADTSLLDSLE